MQKYSDKTTKEQFFTFAGYPQIRDYLTQLSGQEKYLFKNSTELNTDKINKMELKTNTADIFNFQHFKQSFNMLFHEKKLLQYHNINETIVQANAGNAGRNMNNLKRYQEILELNNFIVFICMFYYSKLQNYTGPFTTDPGDVKKCDGTDPLYLSHDVIIKMIESIIQPLSELTKQILNVKFDSKMSDQIIQDQINKEELENQQQIKPLKKLGKFGLKKK